MYLWCKVSDVWGVGVKSALKGPNLAHFGLEF